MAMVGSLRRRTKGAVRTSIRHLFGDRCMSVRGESGLRVWYRPAEYPSLLAGFSRYEPGIKKDWAGLVRPGDQILDIGANIGLTVHRFWALLDGDCRIWAFEPLPRNLDLLRRNVEQLGSSRIAVVPFAVGDYDGEATFLDNLRHGALSKLADVENLPACHPEGLWDASLELTVPMVKIDSFLRVHPEIQPSLIKLDIEGAGHRALAGAADTLRRYHPIVTCSFHGSEERSKVTDILVQYGYGQLPGATESTGIFVHPERR
jgi:FkbM family methyltransferase